MGPLTPDIAPFLREAPFRERRRPFVGVLESRRPRATRAPRRWLSRRGRGLRPAPVARAHRVWRGLPRHREPDLHRRDLLGHARAAPSSRRGRRSVGIHLRPRPRRGRRPGATTRSETPSPWRLGPYRRRPDACASATTPRAIEARVSEVKRCTRGGEGHTQAAGGSATLSIGRRTRPRAEDARACPSTRRLHASRPSSRPAPHRPRK